MKWKTGFWLAIILSLGYMIWKAIVHKKLVCGFLKMNPCTIKSWLINLGIMFIILFVVLVILFGVLTRKRKSFGKIKMPKIKKEKIIKI